MFCEQRPYRSTRRQFLGRAAGGSVVLTFGGMVPGVLRQAAAQGVGSDGRVLVVIELAGGNDGLNSVIPHTDEVYRRTRPELAIDSADVLAIDDQIGLHPALRGFADLLEQGRFAAVQGVGYPNPNRSHFESMDIWHSCQRKDESRLDGWLGRYLDAAELGATQDPAAIHLGHEQQPFALMSRDVRVPSVNSLEQFRLRHGTSADLPDQLRKLSRSTSAASNELLDFVQSSTVSALDVSARMESAGLQYSPSIPYPETSLGEKLETVAKLIAADFGTSVYYLRLDGFDTHANQPAAHAGLLREVGDAVKVFTEDLVAHGDGDRVLTFCFSEFGRRVAENASQGTDHGTAAPVFLAGTRLRGGLIGRHPRLDQLEQGDLLHHTDFRQVYASLLENWLGCPSDPCLLGRFEPLELFV